MAKISHLTAANNLMATVTATTAATNILMP